LFRDLSIVSEPCHCYRCWVTTYWLAQIDLHKEEGDMKCNACNHHYDGGVARCAFGHEAEITEQQAKFEAQYASDVALKLLDQ
jgi:hypothetical protein